MQRNSVISDFKKNSFNGIQISRKILSMESKLSIKENSFNGIQTSNSKNTLSIIAKTKLLQQSSTSANIKSNKYSLVNSNFNRILAAGQHQHKYLAGQF